MDAKGRFTKGDSRAGRKRGKPNKLNGDLKAMIEGALADAGGQDYLTAQAKSNPGAFLALLGKTLPKDVKLNAGVSLEVNLVGVNRSAHDQL